MQPTTDLTPAERFAVAIGQTPEDVEGSREPITHSPEELTIVSAGLSDARRVEARTALRRARATSTRPRVLFRGVRRGRAARAATNARTRGSRRRAASRSPGGGSSDPDESDSDAPARGGRVGTAEAFRRATAAASGRANYRDARRRVYGTWES